MKTNNFLDAINRLKCELRMSKNREIAEALGLKDTALASYKRRGAFPERHLYNLAKRRPDLRIDVNFVMTGKSRCNLATEDEALSKETIASAAWIRLSMRLSLIGSALIGEALQAACADGCSMNSIALLSGDYGAALQTNIDLSNRLNELTCKHQLSLTAAPERLIEEGWLCRIENPADTREAV